MDDDLTRLPAEGPKSSLLSEGQTFGQYKVIRLLGRGGMGEVYEVAHTVLHRRYALKVIRPEVLSRPSAVERFRREAQVMNHLEHPNIVQVDEYGETDGHTWLRMQLIGGEADKQRSEDRGQKPEINSLADLLTGEPLPETLVVDLISQILEGLAYAHSKGAIHRDIKPSNILLEFNHDFDKAQPKGEHGDTKDAPGAASEKSPCLRALRGKNITAKIADFGLVHMAGEDWVQSQVKLTVARSQAEPDATHMDGEGQMANGESQTGTSTQALLGTFEYMAPEQKRGEPADERSDLFAVGLIAFRMLTGHESPGFELPSELVPGLNPAWDHWIKRALAQDKGRRVESARAMRDALPGHVSGNQVTDEVASLQEPKKHTEKPPPENASKAKGVLVVIGLVLVLGIVAVVGLRMMQVDRDAERIEEAQPVGVVQFNAEADRESLKTAHLQREINKKEAPNQKEEIVSIDGFGETNQVLSTIQKDALEKSDLDTGLTFQQLLEKAEQCEEVGDYKSAIRTYWAAISLSKNSADVWNLLSRAYYADGQLTNADTTALEAVRLSPEEVAYTLDFLRVAQRSRTREEFLMQLETAYGHFPSSPEITLSLARAHERISKDSFVARNLYLRFLDLAPNHPLVSEAHNAVKRLENEVQSKDLLLSPGEEKLTKHSESKTHQTKAMEDDYEYNSLDRSVTQTEGGKKAGDLMTEGTEQSESSETISIAFVNEDVRVILKNIAELYELNLVLPGTLKGNITINLKDVTWQQAFDRVLADTGFSYIIDRRIVIIERVASARSRESDKGSDLNFYLGGGKKLEMVWVEALDGWVGKYEVTNGQYRLFKSSHDSGAYEGHSLNGGNQPVVEVSFNDAEAYVKWLNEKLASELPEGFRFGLPDGEQWMTSAQCGDGRTYPWGNDWPPKYGNYHGQEGAGPWWKVDGYRDGHVVSAPVASSGRNNLGLFGVGGNVLEWTREMSGRHLSRVLYGASWSYNSDEQNLSCKHVNLYNPEFRRNNIGFRVLLFR